MRSFNLAEHINEESPVLENLIKSSERDSGYVSASRPGTLTAQSEAALQDGNIQMPPMDRMDETEMSHGNDEVQSLSSDDDDINSQASVETTMEGMAGKDLIRAFFAGEPQFRQICGKVIAQIGKKRFVENLRRMLKAFHKNLSEEAKSEAEKAIVILLRSRRGRLRISERLAIQIQKEGEEDAEGEMFNPQVAPEHKYLVETWIERTSETYHGIQEDPWTSREYEDLDLQDPDDDQDSIEASGDPGVQELQIQDADREDVMVDADSESSTLSDDGSIADEFPYISNLEDFLRGTRSFRILQRDCMLMFLPIELRQVLVSIPKANIWVACEQDLSLTNRMKLWIEDTTDIRWNWWPLEAHKRLLRDGESRMFWLCSCGIRQWEEISLEQHNLIQKVLELSDEKPKLQYWCNTKGNMAFTATARPKHQTAVPISIVASGSSAAQRYTPSADPTSPSPVLARALPTSQIQGNLMASAQQNQQGGPSIAQSTQANVSTPAVQLESFILFGVQGSRRTLTPGQVPVTEQSTDYSVFQGLKKCYRTYRGRMRLWFSIWRLEFCEVVKFERLTLDRMVRDHKDLPTDKAYEYSPRSGDTGVRNPPISPHLFQALFYTCDSPCQRLIPHDCLAPPDGSRHVKRIPKRNNDFENDESSPIWGLEAVFAVSFAYVFVYHCLIVAVPFAFFGWWLHTHPGDFQDASVPVTVALGALSLFWSGAGILSSKRKD